MNRTFSQYMAKELIIFDLDGTLTPSKGSIDADMVFLLGELLKTRLIAIIGGGSYTQFQNQLLANLNLLDTLLSHLYLFPTSGATFYAWRDGNWKQVYEHRLEDSQTNKIMQAFKEAFRQTSYQSPKTVYGQVIEHRGSQITFSALGQEARLDAKESWHKNQDCRKQLQEILQKKLPEFEVRLGGLTSIDVTKKGIDKAYGVQQIMQVLGVKPSSILFVGDALYEGGNDYPVKRTGIDTLQVEGPEQTKRFIKSFLIAHV